MNKEIIAKLDKEILAVEKLRDELAEIKEPSIAEHTMWAINHGFVMGMKRARHIIEEKE